jgi:tRNA (cytidine/uridine-2'-O-)-methyltransferase
MNSESCTSPLRFPPDGGKNLAVALFEPEIPLNVGSVARTCACTGVPLHLVGTLGFRLDNRLAKRGGLDYWELAEVTIHRTWGEFEDAMKGRRMWLFSTKAGCSFWDVKFEPRDIMVFGSERTGLPNSMLMERSEWAITIPMVPLRRSLNLSNSVAIALYEGLRQTAM